MRHSVRLPLTSYLRSVWGRGGSSSTTSQLRPGSTIRRHPPGRALHRHHRRRPDNAPVTPLPIPLRPCRPPAANAKTSEKVFANSCSGGENGGPRHLWQVARPQRLDHARRPGTPAARSSTPDPRPRAGPRPRGCARSPGLGRRGMSVASAVEGAACRGQPQVSVPAPTPTGPSRSVEIAAKLDQVIRYLERTHQPQPVTTPALQVNQWVTFNLAMTYGTA